MATRKDVARTSDNVRSVSCVATREYRRLVLNCIRGACIDRTGTLSDRTDGRTSEKHPDVLLRHWRVLKTLRQNQLDRKQKGTRASDETWYQYATLVVAGES